ncbi:hypothetical protein TIFTF001_004168 [Ficus carica]|uniref:Uncharacterized protein n=1 Tax=Ficus carica TaxID=3494 RepID=A0AA88CVJ2_FICCA|nr:hypothetical protein TIFTF001_004168 [Ficus carica]
MTSTGVVFGIVNLKPSLISTGSFLGVAMLNPCKTQASDNDIILIADEIPGQALRPELNNIWTN